MSHSQSVSLSTRIIQWKTEFEATVYGQLDRLKRNCNEKKSSAAQLGQSRIRTKRCDGNVHTIYSSHLPLLGIFIFAHRKRWRGRWREWYARCSECVFSKFCRLVCTHAMLQMKQENTVKTTTSFIHSSISMDSCVCVVLFQVHNMSSTARFVI